MYIYIYIHTHKSNKPAYSIGRKGLEPSTAVAIEFTAQPVIPTNGTFLVFL